MQSVLSIIWIRVAVSISYDDNYYTTGTPRFFQWYKNLRLLFNTKATLVEEQLYF